MSLLRRRRQLLACSAALVLPAGARAAGDSEPALRRALATGGVLMLRHARAPGTFDPPGFRLGDCATQRNLDEVGRRQARQLGAWFAERQVQPARVRSSPWCRCLETARLAFGDRVEAWPALGSPHGADAAARAQALALLREGLAGVVRRAGGLEAWVTHMFVFSALLGEGAGAGEGVLLDLGPDGSPRIVARLAGLGG